MGGPCGTHGRKENACTGSVGMPESKDSLGTPGRIREETTEQDGADWIRLN